MESTAKKIVPESKAKTSHELQFRPFTQTDLPALTTLFERSFGHSCSVEDFRQKFIENPAGPVVAACATSGSRVAGFYAVIPQTFRVGGERVLGAQSVDTMVDPDFRGLGLFRKLANATIEYANQREIRFLMGFPNANSFPGFVRRLNWTHIGDVKRYYRLLNPRQIQAVPKIAKPLLTMASHLLPKGKQAPFRVEDSEIKPKLLASLADAHPVPGICVDRSESWFTWRYAQDDFRCFVAYENGQPAAGVVARVDHYCATILEILGEKEDAKVAALHRLIATCSSRKCSGIRCLVRSSSDEKILRRLAFVRRGTIPFIVRHLSHQTLPCNPLDFNAWTIHGGTSDTR